MSLTLAKESLLKDLDEFEKNLYQAEKYLTTQVDPRSPLIDNMVEIKFCDKTDSFVSLVPRSILSHHYVHFRMSLRRLATLVLYINVIFCNPD